MPIRTTSLDFTIQPPLLTLPHLEVSNIPWLWSPGDQPQPRALLREAAPLIPCNSRAYGTGIKVSIYASLPWMRKLHSGILFPCNSLLERRNSYKPSLAEDQSTMLRQVCLHCCHYGPSYSFLTVPQYQPRPPSPATFHSTLIEMHTETNESIAADRVLSWIGKQYNTVPERITFHAPAPVSHSRTTEAYPPRSTGENLNPPSPGPSVSPSSQEPRKFRQPCPRHAAIPYPIIGRMPSYDSIDPLPLRPNHPANVPQRRGLHSYYCVHDDGRRCPLDASFRHKRSTYEDVRDFPASARHVDRCFGVF